MQQHDYLLQTLIGPGPKHSQTVPDYTCVRVKTQIVAERVPTGVKDGRSFLIKTIIGQLEPSEILLLRTLPLNNSISVHFRKPGYLFYKNDGSAWPNGTFRICTAGSKVPPLLVIVYRTGRARTSSGTRLKCIPQHI